MQQRHIIHVALLIALLAGLNAADAAGATKPNILVMLTDEIGWGDPKCCNAASRIPTPNIDKLAAGGMRFTHAHTPAALCAPTRYSLLTGNCPWRGRSPGGTWGFNVPAQMKPGQRTVAQLLKPAGYHCAMFGKAGTGGFWSFGGNDEPREKLAPIAWGFDYSFLIPRGHQSPPHAFFENGVVVGKVTGHGSSARAVDWDPAKVGAVLLAKTEAFLDDHLAHHKDQPFYMHFCSDGAHSPYVPASTLAGQPLKGATKMTGHTDMIYETDILLGALVAALEKRGLRENTLVIYTSDNGGLPFERNYGHDSVAGLRGLKSTIFEGGHRVPYIANWPGRIPAGTVRTQPIGIHDTVATALELAGLDVPRGQAIDSVSLVSVLLGQRDDTQPVRQSLLVQSSPGRGPFIDKGFRAAKPGDVQYKDDETDREEPQGAGRKLKEKHGSGIAFAVYDGDWKLVLTAAGEPAALYDLSKDLGEETNLIQVQPKRVTEMAKTYRHIRGGKP